MQQRVRVKLINCQLGCDIVFVQSEYFQETLAASSLHE